MALTSEQDAAALAGIATFATAMAAHDAPGARVALDALRETGYLTDKQIAEGEDAIAELADEPRVLAMDRARLDGAVSLDNIPNGGRIAPSHRPLTNRQGR